MLRLKQHKENGTRRMLLRNSGTGKLTIVSGLTLSPQYILNAPQNFNIYPGMNTTASGKVVTFVGHEEGTSTTYRLRVKSEEQANELKRAVDREIEFVKGKSDA